MMERGARETLTVGAARPGPGRQRQAPGQSFRGQGASAASGSPRWRHGVRGVRSERRPDGRFGVVDRGPAPAWSLSATGRVSTRTMVAMKRATGRCDSWVRWPARKGRQPETPAGGAVRGGDIIMLCAVWTVGVRARAESYAKSVSCAQIGLCRADFGGTVLLAIAVDIASKAVNARAARAREHRAHRAPALLLAATQHFDIKKVFSRFANSSRTRRPPEAAHAAQRFCSR